MGDLATYVQMGQVCLARQHRRGGRALHLGETCPEAAVQREVVGRRSRVTKQVVKYRFPTVSGGTLHMQRKIWAAADFQNFLTRPNTRRPRKKGG